MTGRKRYNTTQGHMAFWLSNVGMLGMTVAFGVAGVAQVYLERKQKLDFMDVQNEVAVHFVVLLLCATLFTTGIVMFIIEFIKYGRPTDEALEKEIQNIRGQIYFGGKPRPIEQSCRCDFWFRFFKTKKLC